MADDEKGGLINPEPIREKINTKAAQLMDLNQRVTSILRKQAKDYELVGSTFSALANRAYELSELTAELAVVSAHNTGDIIMAEFGLVPQDDDDDDDDQEDDDGQGSD